LLVGAAGIVLWVGFCQLHWEEKIFAPLGAKWLVDLGVRSGYDPFKELRHCAAGWQWAFLGLRVFGLVAVVPVIEEFFLRGFLMRWPIAERWWEVPVGTLTGMALLLGTLYPVLSHPAEMFAAVAWFTLVTLLAWKTKNIWDCVAAHAVTNLLLGVYVVSSGEWRLL